jgi:hypothetical protein
MRIKILRRPSVAAALMMVFTLLAGGAAQAGPFSALAGAWAGGGVLTISGAREPIRCRAIYFVADGGESLRLILRCASDSYNIDVNADAVAHGGRFSGTWSEQTSGTNGTLGGVVRGAIIEGAISGVGVSAPLLIVTHGHSQHATISLGGPSVAVVIVNFRRAY